VDSKKFSSNMTIFIESWWTPPGLPGVHLEQGKVLSQVNVRTNLVISSWCISLFVVSSFVPGSVSNVALACLYRVGLGLCLVRQCGIGKKYCGWLVVFGGVCSIISDWTSMFISGGPGLCPGSVGSVSNIVGIF